MWKVDTGSNRRHLCLYVSTNMHLEHIYPYAAVPLRSTQLQNPNEVPCKPKSAPTDGTFQRKQQREMEETIDCTGEA